MNEPRKIAFVALIVMAIGLVALAVEWARDTGRQWLILIGISAVLLIAALMIWARAGA